MNAREAMLAAIWALREREDEPTGGEVVDAVLAALCPPGSRVVVSRESKPCEPCGGAGQWYHQDTYDAVSCESCGGSGVVEATTTYGLEAVAGAWWNETYARRGDLVIDDDRQDGDMPLYRLVAAVALPEETPQ